MNQMQRRRAAEVEAAPMGIGYWCSRTKISIGGVIHPAGSVVDQVLIEAMARRNLQALIDNRMLQWRPGEPPANAPAPVPVATEDEAATRAAMRANMLSNGYRPDEIDANAVSPQFLRRRVRRDPSPQPRR
jgi:hypothetical protein